MIELKSTTNDSSVGENVLNAHPSPPTSESFTTSSQGIEVDAKTASGGSESEPSQREFAQDWSDVKMPKAVDFALLDARRIDLDKPPEKPVPIFELLGQQICTAGNLTVISAQAKAGKTAVITGMLGAALHVEPLAGVPADEPDYLGFSARPHAGKAVVLFDTEQAPYDAWSLIHRSRKRAKASTLPENFRCYSVADVSTKQRREYLAAELQRASAACGGIHCVFIDGIADLCIDPNDIAESFGLVEELVQLAIKHACPIIIVLHENPSGTGQDYSKGRGHLGSQLERKAESNLRVIKDKEGVSTIFSDRCRRASIPKNNGALFEWSDALAMHVTVVPETEVDKDDKKRADQLPAVAEVFGKTRTPLSWGDLKQRIKDVVRVKDRAAERRINDWKALGMIKTHPKGGYVQS